MKSRMFLYNTSYFRVIDADARKSLCNGLTNDLSDVESSSRKDVFNEYKKNIKSTYKLDKFKIYLTVINVLSLLASIFLPIVLQISAISSGGSGFYAVIYGILWYSNFVLIPLFIISYVIGIIAKKVQIKYTLYNIALVLLSIILHIIGIITVLYIIANGLESF